MGGTGPIRRTIRVVNPLGLHLRPAQAFMEAAKRYASAVTVWNGPTRADGRSFMELILLAALSGTELTLEIEGPDAEEAMGPLAELLSSPGE